MSGLAWVLVAVAVFNVGLLTGAALFCIGTATNSHEIWEVTRRDGSVQWFTEPEDVTVVADLDGFVKVRRLRVLT